MAGRMTASRAVQTRLTIATERRERALTMLGDFLCQRGMALEWVEHRSPIQQSLERGRTDIVVARGLAKMPLLALVEWGRSINTRVPIIALTEEHDAESRIRALQLGATDAISILCEPAELAARIDAAQHQAERAAHANSVTALPVPVGPYRFEPANARIVTEGQQIALTHNECAILQALARNAGHALSRDELSRSTRGTGLAPEDRTIDVLIARLRKKIETDARQPTIIETVRGLGYRLNQA